MGGVILQLPMGGNFGGIVGKAMRPYAMLGQQQRQWQQDAEKTGKQAVHDGPKYTAWCRLVAPDSAAR